MKRNSPHLDVVVYHYVRDLPRTQFPAIKGMLTSHFERQLDCLHERYEFATLESAMAYLGGDYRPRKNLCLLTFDDGIKDHFENVFPLLEARRIQGIFLLPTCCIEEQTVVDVHKNQFLMAAVGDEKYSCEVFSQLAAAGQPIDVDERQAQSIYRWDNANVARLKYVLNFQLSAELRSRLLAELFQRFLGDEREFARQLYLSWEEARQLQRGGMILGGHSHRHLTLATLDADAQRSDIASCATLLHNRLDPQPDWPFSYPHGVPEASFNDVTERAVVAHGFSCAFSTEVGANRCGRHSWTRIRRHDANDIAA